LVLASVAIVLAHGVRIMATVVHKCATKRLAIDETIVSCPFRCRLFRFELGVNEQIVSSRRFDRSSSFQYRCSSYGNLCHFLVQTFLRHDDERSHDIVECLH
jgi:hypothetical protein